MRVVILKLKEPVEKLVMCLDGEKIELKKVPDDPGVKVEFGDTLCSVMPRPDKDDISFISNDDFVHKGKMFDPKERDRQPGWLYNSQAMKVLEENEEKLFDCPVCGLKIQRVKDSLDGKLHLEIPGMITPKEKLLQASLSANCGEIDHLAKFILEKYPDEPGRGGSESAVDVAIRLLEKG